MTISAEKPADVQPSPDDEPPRQQQAPERPAKARRRRSPWVGILTFIVIAWLLMFVLPAYLTLNPAQARIALNPNVALHYPLLVVHVATGTIAMLTGCLQLSRRVRRKYPRVHRISGRIYAIAILLGAPALIALIVLRGQSLGLTPSSTVVGFGALTILWVATTAVGWARARQRRFADHRRMMIYSFAMTLSIMWSRIAFVVAFSIPGFDLRWVAENVGWAPWVINLVIAQLWLNRTARRRPQTASNALAASY